LRDGIYSARALAAAHSKPLAFASEVMNRPWDPVCGDIDVLAAEGLGWFAWELMVSHSGWGVPKCDGCPIYQGLLWPNGSAFSAEERSCVRGDGAVLWYPLRLPAPAPPPARVLAGRAWPTVEVRPAAAWRQVAGGTAFLPWENKPLRGQGGVEVSGAAPGATLQLRFTGTAVAAYVSTAPSGANATVSVDGAPTAAALVGGSAAPRHAAHAWLARDLARGPHTLTLRFGAGRLVLSGLDVWA